MIASIADFARFGIDIPQGFSGDEASTICPQCSVSRRKSSAKCLHVNLEKGVWYCHHCHWKGGIRNAKVYSMPTFNLSRNTPTFRSARKLLTDRGISDDVLDEMKVSHEKAFLSSEGKEVDCLVFPYFRGDICINVKYRAMSKKSFMQFKDAEPIFYGMNTIKPESTELVICEGEIDVLSLLTVGVSNVVSVPNGAPAIGVEIAKVKFDYLDICSEMLERMNKVIFAGDNDGTGVMLQNELARRIGFDKCWRVAWPDGCKDANDVLSIYGELELRSAMESAKPWPIEGVLTTDDITDDVISLYFTGMEGGVSTGWPGVDKFYTVKPGELTIVTGVPSHGKAENVNTLIPTPSGWTTMGEIRSGDTVFDDQGVLCQVTGVTGVQIPETAYEMEFSDGTIVQVCGDHQWITWDIKAHKAFDYHCRRTGTNPYAYPDNWPTWSSGAMSTKNYCHGDRSRMRNLRANGMTSAEVGAVFGCTANAIELQWNLQEPVIKVGAKIVTTADIAATLMYRGRPNHAIPTTKPLDFPSTILPIHPYVLGYLLGDGDTSGSGRVACHPQDREWLIAEFRLVGYAAKPYRDDGHFGVLGLSKLWRGIGLHVGKFIPDVYLQASIEQRILLVQGMIDSDGHVDSHGSYRFTNSCRALVDGFRELVSSLGLVPITHERAGRRRLNRTNKTSWEVIVSSSLPLAKLPRKAIKARHEWKREQYSRRIVRCDPIEPMPMRCIQVNSPSRQYLCTKAFIPTHNSLIIDNLIYQLAMLHGWRFGMFSPENAPVHDHVARLIEKHIGKPFNKGRTPRMELEDVRRGLEWLRDRVIFLNPPMEDVTIDYILGMAKKLVFRYGIRGLVIDPWNELDHSRSRDVSMTEHVSICLTKIRRFARINECHVWVVAHPMKMRKEKGKDGKLRYPVPTPYDVSDSAAWRNRPDNCITIYRDFDVVGHKVLFSVQKVRRRTVGEVGDAYLELDTTCGKYYDEVKL